VTYREQIFSPLFSWMPCLRLQLSICCHLMRTIHGLTNLRRQMSKKAKLLSLTNIQKSKTIISTCSLFPKYSRCRKTCMYPFSPQDWSQDKSSSNSKTRCFVLCSTRSGLPSCPRCQISRSMNKTEPSLRMRRTVDRRVPYKC